MKIIKLQSQDAYFNLAAEEYFFQRLDNPETYFILYQNSKAVVVGSHQNTIEEVNIDFAKNNNIQIARRLSGGGTVYHDLGNLNYSIIAHSDEMQWDIKHMTDPIIKALQVSGVKVNLNERNDILIDGRKISGSAQFIKGKRLLHHGTLLFHSDLAALSEALRVGDDFIESRSIKSVRSGVTNIKDFVPDLTIRIFMDNLIDVLDKGSAVEEYALTKEDHQAISNLRDEKYGTWEWIYGKSPDHSVRKERYFGGRKVTISIVIKKGIIKAVQLDGDFGVGSDIDEIEKRLTGTRMVNFEVSEALSTCNVGLLAPGLTAKDLAGMIVS